MARSMQLRYPTALDLPPEPPGRSPGGGPGPGAGVSIDRRVFRRLRRRSGGGGVPEEVGPQLRPSSAPAKGGRREAERPRLEVDLPYGPGQWPGLQGEEDVAEEETEEMELQSEAGGEPSWHSREGQEDVVHDEVLNSQGLLRSRSQPLSEPVPSPGQWLASVRGAAGAGAPWLTPSPSSRRRGGKSDPVSRGAQVRAQWSRDRFLQGTGRRKFDLRGCGSPCGQASLHRGTSLLIPTYVPPHEKRRDFLRMQVRQRMLVPDLLA